MNLCIVGKYPPIQGGVSKETYWLAYGLAQRGHRVVVVSNSPEVEKRYRIFMDDDDRQWLEPRFPDTDGSVMLKTVDVFSHRRMTHIPLSKPFLSELAGLAAQTVRDSDSDLLFGYYLEPYGMAAHLASMWTGRPYVVKHAGSDIDRLMNVPALGESYKQVFRGAAAVVTSLGLAPRFLRIGVHPEALAHGIGYELPSHFRADQRPLDIRAQLVRTRDWLDYVPAALRDKSTDYDAELPTIGVYGKVGETKGSYDLIRSLASVKSHGHRFNFLCMVNGLGFPRFANALIEAGLTECAWILPFLPHWKVPGFIKACTAVCFLERDFPIAIHGPSVPREVLSCGGCLIVSREIADKQSAFLNFRSGENSLIVRDPRDHDELAMALSTVIVDPRKARAIGDQADTAFIKRPERDRWIVEFESLFKTVATTGGAATIGDRSELPKASPPNITLASLLPWTARLQTAYPDHIPSFDDPGADITVDSALSFCERTLRGLAGTNGSHAGVRSIVSFESAVLAAIAGAQHGGAPFRYADGVGDWQCTREEFLLWRPELNRHVRFQPLEYDLAACQRLLDVSLGNLAFLDPAPCIVMILPRPNGSVKYVRVSRDADALLHACDGQRTVSDVLALMAGRQPSETVVAAGCAALKQFHDTGAVSFH